MKPERSEMIEEIVEVPAWEISKATLNRTYPLPFPSDAGAFAGFAERLSAKGASSEASFVITGNELVVEISSAVGIGVTDAEHQLAEVIDKVYGLFMDHSGS